MPTVVAFIGLALAWGSSFLFIKVALTDGMAPLTLVTWRLIVATAFLSLLLWLAHGSLPRSRDALRRAATLALLNVALPFAFIAWGVQWIPSAVGAMVNGMVPLFSIVLAALVLPDEPITAGRLGGLALGFGGAFLLAAPNLGSGGSADATMQLLGELAVLLGTVGYASGYVYARRNVTGRPMISEPGGGMRIATPLENAATQSLLALPMVGLAAVVLEHPPGGVLALPPSDAAWVAVAWLGLIGSGVAYLFFFRVVRDWGAMRASLVTYLVPIVGIVLGLAFLGESLEPSELVGAALIITGVVVANGRLGARRLWGRARPATS